MNPSLSHAARCWRGVSGAVLAVALLVPLTRAEAVVVSGSFSARANTYSFEGTTVRNVPVTGHFSFDVDALVIDPDYIFGDPPRPAWLAPNLGALSIEVNYGTYTRRLGQDLPMWVTVSNTPSRQTVTLNAWWGLDGVTLTLVSPSGQLVDGDDPRTFRPGPVNLPQSDLTFGAHRYRGDGSLREVHFDPVAAPVPEPEVGLMVLVGLCALAWRRRSAARSSPSGVTVAVQP